MLEDKHRSLTVVICVPGGGIGQSWLLPESRSTKRNISGGERTLYEWAVALAKNNWNVELRGDINETLLLEVSKYGGGSPRINLEARLPSKEDIIVVPEGFSSPVEFLNSAVAPSCKVMAVLGPIGMFGWPFDVKWEAVDALEVSEDRVGKARYYSEIKDAGFEFITNSLGLQKVTEDQTGKCYYVGCGQPIDAPQHSNQSFIRDVAVIGSNRWVELALECAALLDKSISVEVLPSMSRESLIKELSRSKVFIHPVRIEGTARLTLESRSVGCIPACLENPYGAGFSKENGVIVGNDVKGLAKSISEVLSSEKLQKDYREGGLAFVKRELDWDSFTSRIDKVFIEIEKNYVYKASSRQVFLNLLTQSAVEEEKQKSFWHKTAAERLDIIRNLEADSEQLHADNEQLRADNEQLRAELETIYKS